MANKLVLRREGARLVAPTQDWADLLCELPENVDLNIKATRARSLPQLGTYWGVLSFVIKHGPEWIGERWPHRDELSDALQLEAGFVRQIQHPALEPGQVYAVPQSKSFSECSQDRFNDYFNRVQMILSQWCNFPAVETYLQWMAERGRAE